MQFDFENIIDFRPFIELKESDPKTIVMSLGKAMGNMKVLATIFCFFFGIYAIGYETVFVPSMADLKRRDDAIQSEKELLEQKEQQQAQFERWETETSALSTKMVRLKPEQSAKVISLKESEKVVSLAKTSPDSKLPDPHNKREGISLNALDSATLTISNGQSATVGGDAPPQPGIEGDGSRGEDVRNGPINVEQFDYKINLSGTYPAVVDFVNQIVSLDNLIAIKEITIERIGDASSLPDPEKFPDYPVKVNMTVLFSIYLYVPTGAGIGG